MFHWPLNTHKYVLKGDEIILLPLNSASLVLSMAAAGAGGDTRTEMLTGREIF